MGAASRMVNWSGKPWSAQVLRRCPLTMWAKKPTLGMTIRCQSTGEFDARSIATGEVGRIVAGAFGATTK